MVEFKIPADAIQAEAAVEIAAPPETVAAIYRSIDRWGEIFPATIESARVILTGENWKQIEVSHKQEGRVPNTLFDLSANEIGLIESKHRYDASFVNRFELAPGGGTHYVLQAYIRLKGLYRILRPFLKRYVRRKILVSMQDYVLNPLKDFAEKTS